MPHKAHVGDEEHTEIALVCGQVPNALDLVVDLLVREEDELLVLDDRSAKFQISEQF